MPKRTEFLIVPSSFIDDFETLVNTAPPPKTAKDKAERATAKRIIQWARTRTVRVLDDDGVARMVAKKRAALKKKAAEKKSR
jgi:hypothetical protein